MSDYKPNPRKYNARPGGVVETGPRTLSPRVGRAHGKNFNGYIPEVHHPQYYPARNQSGWDLVGNALGQFANEVVMGAAEGAGYLVDVRTWGTLWADGEFHLSNAWSDWAREKRDQIRDEVFPVYDTQESEGFSPWVPRWWAKNFGTIGSFLSILIPMTGGLKALGLIGKGASWAARAAKLEGIAQDVGRFTGLGSKTAEWAATSMTAAGMSRHMEGLMEANGLMQQMLDEGYSYDEAAAAAAQNYKSNAALFFVDLFQMGALFSKGSTVALQRMFSRGAKKRNPIVDALIQAPGEGFEEGYQHISQVESKARIDGEAPGGPFGLFAENFMDRWDDYMRDDDMWTAVLMGAFGGLVTPMTMNNLNKVGKVFDGNFNPFAKKKAEEDALRKYLSEEMTMSQEEYLKQRDFFTTAMRFASSRRMHDMEGWLETFKKDFAKDPEMADNLKRVEEYLEMLPEFEKIFNKAANVQGYTRKGEWEHIDNTDNLLRIQSVMDQWELLRTKELHKGIRTEFDENLDSITEVDNDHKAAYALNLRLQVAKLLKDEKLVKKLEAELEEEVNKINETDNKIEGTPEEFLVSTQDSVLGSMIMTEYAAEKRIKEIRENIRKMKTTNGQLEILREIDKKTGERKAQMEQFLAENLGDGVVVGNELEEWTIRQEGDKFVFVKPDNPPVHGATNVPVSQREIEEFHKTGELSQPRMAAIANKIREEGVGQLTPDETVMYMRYKDTIDGLVSQNRVDNDGNGFTRIELQKWMAEKGYETKDDRAYKIGLEDKWIDMQRQRIDMMISIAQSELAELQDRRSALQAKANRTKGRWGTSSPSYQKDKAAIAELDKEIASYNKEIAELEEEYEKVEEDPRLHYRRVIPETPTTETATGLFGTEGKGEVTEGSLPVTPDSAPDDSGNEGTKPPPPPDSEQPEEFSGKPARLFYHTFAGAEVLDNGDYSPFPSQIRYYQYVKTHPFAYKGYGAQIIPLGNKDGSINRDNYEKIYSAEERAMLEEELSEAEIADMMVAVLVDSKGNYINSKREKISFDQIASQGLFTTIKTPGFNEETRKKAKEYAKKGIRSDQHDLIDAELEKYERSRNAMRAAAWKGDKVYVQVLGKTNGIAPRRSEDIPIADALGNLNSHTRLSVTKNGLIQGDAMVAQGIHPGSPYIWDPETGNIIVGFTRKLGDKEIASILRLLEEANNARHGLEFQPPTFGGKAPISTMLRAYMYVGKPSQRFGDGITHYNEGGDLYASKEDPKILILRDFGGEKKASVSIETLLNERREEFVEWLKQRRRMVDGKRLPQPGESNKHKQRVNRPWTEWWWDGQSWKSKQWKNYKTMLLDPTEGIVRTTRPAFTAEEDQFVNQNLIFNHTQWESNRIKFGDFPFTQEPEQTPGERQGKRKGGRRGGKPGLTAEEVAEIKKAKSEAAETIAEIKKAQAEEGKDALAEVKKAQAEEGKSTIEQIKKAKSEGKKSNPSNRTGTRSGKPVGESKKIKGEPPKNTTNPTKDQTTQQNVNPDPPPVSRNTGARSKRRPSRRDNGAITPKDRAVDPDTHNSDYVQEDLVAAEKWFKERFPDVEFEVVHWLVKSGAWGRFTEAGKVLLDANAMVGTIYHEAFHVTTGLFLSRGQVQALYNEYRRKFKEQGLPDTEVEERLAELFREYVQYGTVPKELTRAKSWFEKLLDYLRMLIGRPDIMTTFRRIDNGYYARLTPDYKRLYQSYDRKIEDKFTFHGHSAEFTREAVSGLHLSFTEYLRSTGNMSKFISGDLDGNTLKEAYKYAYQELEAIKQYSAEEHARLTGGADAAIDIITKTELETRIDHVESIQNKFWTAEKGPSFIELHRRYLSNLGLKVLEETEEIDEDSAMADPDNDWAAVHIEKSHISSASMDVRLHLSSIREFEEVEEWDQETNELTGRKIQQEVRNSLDLAVPMKFGKTFQLLAKKLSNTYSIEQQVEAVQELLDRYPDMEQVLKDFALLDSTGRGGTAQMRRIQFFQVFARHVNNYTKDIIHKKRAPQRILTGSTNKKKAMISSWETGFDPKNVPQKAIDNYNKTGEAARSFQEALELAEAIGIELVGAWSSTKRHERQTLVAKINRIFFTILSKGDNPFGLDENGEPNNYGDLGAIASIELLYDPDYIESSHIGMKNTSIYDLVQYSYWDLTGTKFNRIVQDGLERGASEEQIMNDILTAMPHLNGPYATNSILLQRIAAHRSASEEAIAMAVEEGITDWHGDITGEYSQLSATDKLIKEMIDLTKGIYHMIRPNDNSLERTYTIGANPATNRGQHYFELDKIQLPTAEQNKFVADIIKKYLQDEMRILNAVRVKDPERYDNWKNFTKTMKNDDLMRNAGVFSAILFNRMPADVLKAFTRTINRKTKTEDAIEKFLESEKGQRAISIIQTTLKRGALERILPALDAVGFFESDLILHEFEEIAKETNQEGKNIGKGKIAFFLQMNHMMNVVEQTKVFHGHPAQYKNIEDFIKRLGGSIGPKRLSAIDPETNKILKEVFGIEGAETPFMRFATIRDPLSASEYDYLDVLTQRYGKVVGETKAELYRMIQEADAHAVMTLDAYREFNMRQANWDYKREMAYLWQKQEGWRGKEVRVPADNPFRELFDEDIVPGGVITRRMIEKNGMLLVSQKPQGFGPIEGTEMIGMLKLATTPLLPEMIANSPEMQALNKKLEDQGIHLAVMESGNKLGVRTLADGRAQSLYDDNGNITSDNFITQEMSWEYFGIQVDNTPDQKFEASNGSQMQRQIEAGLYHMGIPIDWIMKQIDPERAKEVKTRIRRSYVEDLLNAIDPLRIDEKSIPEDHTIIDADTGVEGLTRKTYERNIKYAESLHAFEKRILSGSSVSSALIQAGFEEDAASKISSEIRRMKKDEPITDLTKRLKEELIQDLNEIRKAVGLPTAKPKVVESETISIEYVGQYDARMLDATKEKELLEKWESMSEAERERESKVHETINNLRNAQRAAIEYSFKVLLRKLGLKRDGETFTRDPERDEEVKEFLLGELSKRDLPVNMLDAVRYIDQGLDVMVNTGQLQAILMAIATKRVLSRKKFGAGLTLVPNTFGTTKARTAAYVSEDGKTVWKADDLKSYRTEDGEIKGFEVYLPHKYKELWGSEVRIEDIDPRLLEMIGFRIPTQALASVEFFTVKGFLPQALGDSIMVPPEIVAKTGADFDWDKLFVHMRNYREENGRLVPVDIIEDDAMLWAARREEFAKEFEYKKYKKIVDDYKKKLSRLVFGDSISREEWLRIIDPLMEKPLPGHVFKVLKELKKQLEEDKSENVIDDSAGEILTENIEEAVAKRQKEILDLVGQRDYQLEQLYAELKPEFDKLDSFEQQGLKYIDNVILDRQLDLMKMPGRMGELMAPITTDTYGGLAQRLQEERQKFEEANNLSPTVREQSFASLLNPVQLSRIGHNLVKSKQNIGIPALGSTNHINNTQANIIASVVSGITLTHNRNAQGEVLFGRQATTDRKHLIADLMNELISGYVDAGNNPFMVLINGGETAAIYSLLTEIGVPPELQVAFLNQPIIEEYLYLKEIQNSKFLRIRRSTLRAKNLEELRDNMLKALLEKAGKESIDVLDSKLVKKLNNVDTMWNHAKIAFNQADSSFKDLDQYDAELQYAVLLNFIRLEEAANTMREVIQSTTHNTKFTGRDILIALNRLAYTDSIITNYWTEEGTPWSDYFDSEQYLSHYRDGVQDIVSALRPFHFITRDEKANAMLSRMLKELNSLRTLSEDDKYRFLRMFNDEFLTYIYHVYGIENVKQRIGELLLSKRTDPVTGEIRENTNTLPKRILKLAKEIKAGQKKANILIQDLAKTIKLENESDFESKFTKDGKEFVVKLWTDNMALIPGTKLNSNLIDEYVQAYRELAELDESIYEDLFDFIMLQSGLTSSPNNFSNIIPSEIYQEKMSAAIEKASNELEEDVFWRTFASNEFFLNNHRDPLFDTWNPKEDLEFQFLATKQYIPQPKKKGKKTRFQKRRKRRFYYRLDGAVIPTSATWAYENFSDYASLRMYTGATRSESGISDRSFVPETPAGKDSVAPPSSENDKAIEDLHDDCPF